MSVGNSNTAGSFGIGLDSGLVEAVCLFPPGAEERATALA